MNSSRLIRLLLLVADIVSTVVVFELVNYSRGLPGHLSISALMLPAALLILGIYLIDGYRIRTDVRTIDYTSSHIIAIVITMLVMLLLTFILIPAGYELQESRVVIVFSFLALIVPTLGVRRLLHRQLSAVSSGRSLLYLGDRAGRADFRRECAKMGVRQPVLYSSFGPADDAEPGEVLRPLEEVLRDISEGRLSAGAIVLRESSRELSPATAERLVDLYFRGIPTYTLELFHQIYWQKIPLYRLNSTWLFQEGFQIAREPVFERLKRTTDIVFSVVGLALCGPFIGVLALLIWLEDRGPAFFRQYRIGKNQVPFQVLKLRTMRIGSSSGNRYTQPNDKRITRIGRLLRASRLDELPQLWNVLKGEMSLIGPRAEWDRLAEEYQRQIPCYNYRHLVRPGITGWAQVNFTYGASLDDTLMKLEYDLYYIRHFSFILDASIFLKTIQVILFGKGR